MTVKVSKNWKVLLDFIFSKTVGVGVVPRTESDEIPDIMEIQRAELSDDQDCFYNEPGINQMRIQVLRLIHDACSPIKIIIIIRLLISHLTTGTRRN